MNTNNVIDNRESNSHTDGCISSTGFIYSIEFFFYKINLIFRYTYAIITKNDFDRFFGSSIVTWELCGGTSVFDKIRKNIMEYLYEHILIHADIYIRQR